MLSNPEVGMREPIVAGIVRPKDTQSDNTIDSGKIRQACIAYGDQSRVGSGALREHAGNSKHRCGASVD
jgi:flagellar basal body L-ring protein FlgH